MWLAAGSVIAVLMALASRYGFHRDELYFVVAGRRLDWGFVDQPPLTPLLARASELVFGASPWALRILPALAVATVVVLAASIARRLGGGPGAQVFAAVGAGFAGIALALGHLLSTATFEYLLWTVAIWLLVRLLGGDDPRWWLALGLTVGIGLQNKHLIGAFAVAVLLGLAATRQRRLLASPWPWAGAAVAGILALPNLLWQAANDWPQFEMAEALAERSDGPVDFVIQQALLLSVALAVPAGVGLWRLLRSPRLEPWRPIGIVFVVLFVVFLLTGGKGYYVSPLYPVLRAAGALWFEELTAGRRRVMVVAAGVGIAIGSVIALPLLPRSAVNAVDASGELRETVGWPELVDQVAEIHDTIPADGGPVAIFTASYGEAGAIDVLGPERGLPEASSGHNTYWLWGPPEQHGAVIGVGHVEYVMELICPGLEQVGVISNPDEVENEEFGMPLFLCLAPSRQLADVWDIARHYN